MRQRPPPLLSGWLVAGLMTLTVSATRATSASAMAQDSTAAPAIGFETSSAGEPPGAPDGRGGPTPRGGPTTLTAAGPIDPAERFQTGNSLYQAGDFAGALEVYLQIVEAGFDSGDLQYNLGNAYFKVGQLGPAILAYERARQALPADENVVANLELARSLTPDQITPLPGFWLPRAWAWWVDLLPRAALIVVVLAGYFTVMGLLTLRVLRPGGARWSASVAAWIAGITLVFGLNLAIREFGIGRAEYGIVMAFETPVQSAPADDPGLQLFSIHEGTRVRIDRSAEGWLEIVLDDGQVGWLRSETVERI